MNRIPPPSSSPTCGQWRRAAGSQAVPHASCTTSILGSRLCKVTQDAYSQLNYSAALQGKKKKKKKPPHTLLPAQLRRHRGAPAVGATRAVAPRCPKPPEPTGWGIGSRRRAEKGMEGGGTRSSSTKPRIKAQPFISAPDGPAAEMQEGGWQDNSGAQHRRQLGQAAPAHRGGEGPPAPPGSLCWHLSSASWVILSPPPKGNRAGLGKRGFSFNFCSAYSKSLAARNNGTRKFQQHFFPSFKPSLSREPDNLHSTAHHAEA